jgi:Ca2+:H+ antiporter
VSKTINLLGYAAIPAAFASHHFGHGQGWEPTATFVLAALGILPLAHLMGESTEHLAERTGPTLGGLLNATFGNAAELIIAIIAISKGLTPIVHASLTGSILGNLLLVAGGAMVYGGVGREKQTFSRRTAEANAGLLVVAVAAMLFPAIFHFTAINLKDVEIVEHEQGVSVGTSIILLIVYGLGLLFTLKTHAHVFSHPRHSENCEPAAKNDGGTWPVGRAVTMLFLASAGVGVVAELLVGSAETMAHKLGWNEVFVGVILLAIIGNAAEHSTALMLARNGDMDTAMTICYQSSVQIALFVTPFLVLVSLAMSAMAIGHSQALTLIFSPMEVVAVVLTVFIVVVVGMDGETNWFEGALLLGMYAILGIAFFYIPTHHAKSYDTTPTTLPAAAPSQGADRAVG